jgi:hypothetical protein
LASSGAHIGICDEAVKELTVAAIAAKSDVQYEKVRRACVLADRYANASPPPIEWHLGRALGLKLPLPPRPVAGCAFIAESRDRAALRARSRDAFDVGGAFVGELERWSRGVMDEKERWLSSITKAVEAGAPGIVSARKKGIVVRMDRRTLNESKAALVKDSLALAKVELAGMRHVFADWPTVDLSDPTLPARLLPLLAVHVAAFHVAILDRFDGPHNDGRKKIEWTGNDWFDLAQLRYVQPGWCWVTSDKRWVAIARQHGLTDSIKAPDEVS